MCLVEFFADKILYVDFAWRLIYTAIYFLGGITLAYIATAKIQVSIALLSGEVATKLRLAKAIARAAVNI